MAPVSALQLPEEEAYTAETLAPLPKAAQFAFARARIEVQAEATAANSIERLSSTELNQEIAHVAAIYSGLKVQRLYFSHVGHERKDHSDEQSPKLQRVRVMAYAVFATSAVIFMHAVFLAGYNFHQQDAYAFLMWGVVCFAGVMVMLGAFSVLKRLSSVLRGDIYSAGSATYHARRPSPNFG